MEASRVSSEKQRARLIVDSDAEFLRSLQAQAKPGGSTILSTDNGKQAQLFLADTGQVFTGIFVNPSLRDGYGFSVIRFAHRYRPATPIFLICDQGSEPIPQNDLRKLGVQDQIVKPFELASLMKLPRRAAEIELHPQFTVAGNDNSENNTQVEADDSVFTPILAEFYLPGSVSLFDIFVRLASGRYIKILKAGDALSGERIANYLKKGVINFYLRKEAQEVYLSYCAKLGSAINSSKTVSSSTQINFTMNHGQEVMKYLQAEGLSSEAIQQTAQFTQNVRDLVLKTRPENNTYLDDFLNDAANFEHGVGCTMIASMIGKELGMTSSDPVKLIGMACMMHDIGLMELPRHLHDEDTSKMNDEEIALFETHPLLGAEILKSFREIEPTTVQAVLQHHERRDRKGFPNHLGPGQINRISELVSMGDLFVRWLEKAKKDPNIKPVEEMLKILSASFSLPVADAFRRVFSKKIEGDKKK